MLNVHTRPSEDFVSTLTPPIWKFHLNFAIIFKNFGFWRPPVPVKGREGVVCRMSIINSLELHIGEQFVFIGNN